MVRQEKRRATKIRPKATAGGISGRFSNFKKCRTEVAYDVISNVATEYAGVDVRVKFDDFTLNIDRIIQLCFTHFYAVFICLL